MDGSSCADGSGVGLILTSLEGAEFTYALRFRFEATNNEVEYEALIAGLRIAEEIGVKNLQANVDSSSGRRGEHMNDLDLRIAYRRNSSSGGTRSIVAKALQIRYYWPTIHKDARALIRACQDCQEGPGKVKFMIVAIDYFTKWIKAKPVATITDNQVKKIVWDNIVCRFGVPGEIIYDDGKQFRYNSFKDWCEKLCICQHFASVKHPQANGLVERANRILGEGIKATLDARSKNLMEEISRVLWAYSTMIKSSNGDTPFH
nr:reverse transcriptase domain-containing protein [Tanacetum cinerariifolium]